MVLLVQNEGGALFDFALPRWGAYCHLFAPRVNNLKNRVLASLKKILVNIDSFRFLFEGGFLNPLDTRGDFALRGQEPMNLSQ